MDRKLTQEEFDKMPVIGPSVSAFLNLLANIAARSINQNNEEDEKDSTEKES